MKEHLSDQPVTVMDHRDMAVVLSDETGCNTKIIHFCTIIILLSQENKALF